MAFTRNWLSSWILDHSKFKTQPSYVRSLMDDVGERLTDYLYGFATGETYTGFKKLGLITIGTGDGTIPTGTGVQAAINIEGKTIDSKVELIAIDADGNEIQLTSKGDFLPNDAWFTGNKVGTGGSLNIIKINTANQLEIGTGFGVHITGPDTGPTTALQYSPKGYVDAEIAGIVATSVSVTTGTIANGQTIALIDGYTAEQSTWTVALGVCVTGVDKWGGPAEGLTTTTVTVDGSRVVTISSAGHGTGQTGTANYIIIGVK